MAWPAVNEKAMTERRQRKIL